MLSRHFLSLRQLCNLATTKGPKRRALWWSAGWLSLAAMWEVGVVSHRSDSLWNSTARAAEIDGETLPGRTPTGETRDTAGNSPAKARFGDERLVWGPIIDRQITDPLSGERQRSYPSLIDFDTGRILPCPADEYLQPAQDHLYGELLRNFMAANGLDAIARQIRPGSDIGGLVAFDMTVLPVEEQQWEADPDQLIESVQARLDGGVGLLPWAAANPPEEQPVGWTQESLTKGIETPMTFLFETREGGRGLLRFPSMTTSPRVRYKMIQAAAERADIHVEFPIQPGFQGAQCHALVPGFQILNAKLDPDQSKTRVMIGVRFDTRQIEAARITAVLLDGQSSTVLCQASHVEELGPKVKTFEGAAIGW